MPIYRVLEAKEGMIPTCNLTVCDQEGRIFILQVKGELGLEFMVGASIRIATTNREVVPHDIVVDHLEIKKEPVIVPEPPTYKDDEPATPLSNVNVVTAKEVRGVSAERLIAEMKAKQAARDFAEKQSRDAAAAAAVSG